MVNHMCFLGTGLNPDRRENRKSNADCFHQTGNQHWVTSTGQLKGSPNGGQ